MGDGLLDCTTVIITDIPIFKKMFLVERPSSRRPRLA